MDRKKLHERIEVLYEDKDLIVVEKAAGVLSYPVEGRHEESAIRLIRRYWKVMDRPDEQLYLMHRLDKETSGLMVFAKTSLARGSLRLQFEDHSVLRGYLTVTDGVPAKKAGSLSTFLGRDTTGRRAVAYKGKSAITRYQVLIENRTLNRALVRCYLHTGRTHQVRIHMGHMNTPVVGDSVYGRRQKGHVSRGRLALHAEVLGFVHPRSRTPLLLRSSLPSDIRRFLGAPRDCIDLQARSSR